MKVSKSAELWNEIRENPRLKYFELMGFRRGLRRHKTMDVELGRVFESLKKQWNDLRDAYMLCADEATLMRCIADLRNVAGCLFLKIEKREGEAQP